MGRKKRHSDRYDWEDEQEDDLTPQSVSEPQKASPLQARVAALAKQRKEQENSASAKGADQTTKTAAKQEPKKKPERKAKPKNNEPKPPFFVRLSYLISWLTALTLAAVCLIGSTVSVREIFNSDNGILNQFLSLFGIRGTTWISDPNTALLSCAVINVWSAVGYDLVLILAGLQSISRTYYEAAEIDGAGPVA